MDSILDSVKAYLGILQEDTSFDTDIIMAINSVLVILHQLGIGPDPAMAIDDYSTTWADLLGDDPVGGVREYVCMRVRILFDPPSNNQVMAALKEQIDEFGWRILADADKKDYEGVENG